MSHNPTSTLCQWAGLIAACLLGALGLQVFIVLIGLAVSAAGNSNNVWYTVALLFTWPVFFLSLLVMIVMAVIQAIKRCLLSQCSNNSERGCCNTGPDSNKQ